MNYSKEFLEGIIEDIIFEKEKYLNDLAKRHQISLDELILIIKNLKIGNKKLTIKSKCQNCGKDVDAVLSVYETNKNTFCSTDCYYEYKKYNAKKGKDNEQYKRIETKCSNCGKSIEVIPYDYNNTNSFGDRHNFVLKNVTGNLGKNIMLVKNTQIIIEFLLSKKKNVYDKIY